MNMKKGTRIYLEPQGLGAALSTGLVEPDGVDDAGATIYRLTRVGEVLVGGSRSVAVTARRIKAVQPLLFGRGARGEA
jgi:hypothetical protein